MSGPHTENDSICVKVAKYEQLSMLNVKMYAICDKYMLSICIQFFDSKCIKMNAIYANFILTLFVKSNF